VNYGRLVVVVGLNVALGEEESGEKEVVETGREVLSRLHELYYGSGGEEGVLSRLKKAVETVGEEFGGGEIGCVAVVGRIVYVVSMGGVGVWVWVGDKEGWLVNSEGRREEGKVVAMSGKAQDGEVLVLGNKRFWKRLPFGVLKVAMANLEGEGKGGMEAVVETLGAVEHGGSEDGGEVGAVVRLEKEAELNWVKNGEVAEQAATAEEVETDEVEEVREEKPFRPKLNILSEMGRVAHGIRQKLIPDKPVFIVNQAGESGGVKSKKKVIYVGLGFLVVLGMLFGVGRVRNQQVLQKNSLTNQVVEELVTKFRDADAVVNLNPVRSRELLGEVQKGIDNLNEAGKKDPRIVEIVEKMGEVLGVASGTHKAELVEMVNLELLRNDVKMGVMVVGEKGKVWTGDVGSGRVIEISVDKKSGRVVAGKESVGNIEKLAYYPGKVIVWGDKGVVECGVETGECQTKVEKDGGVGEVVSVQTWAGNLYVLDGSNKQIWKYQGTESGYGGRQKWLGEGEQEKVGEVRSMAIDGNIWVLGNQTLTKYTRGLGERVNLSGWDKYWGLKVKMVTNEFSKKLYILDPENKRVVVMNKSGEYEGQWINENFGQMKDVVVDEAAGKMYLLDEKKMWEVGL
jgi:hypothetical protein